MAWDFCLHSGPEIRRIAPAHNNNVEMEIFAENSDNFCKVFGGPNLPLSTTSRGDDGAQPSVIAELPGHLVCDSFIVRGEPKLQSRVDRVTRAIPAKEPQIMQGLMFCAGVGPGFEIQREIEVFHALLSMDHKRSSSRQNVANKFRVIAIRTPPRKQYKIEATKSQALPAKIPGSQHQLKPTSPRSARMEIEMFDPICIRAVLSQIVTGDLHQKSNVSLRGSSAQFAQKRAGQNEIADFIGPYDKNAFGLCQREPYRAYAADLTQSTDRSGPTGKFRARQPVHDRSGQIYKHVQPKLRQTRCRAWRCAERSGNSNSATRINSGQP
jgi:hypothetical protein